MEKYLAKTFAGLEDLLLKELKSLGAQNCSKLTRAVSFEGDIALLYKVNYYSRLSLRILVQLKEFEFSNNNQFYSAIFSLESEKYLRSNGTLAVSATLHETIFNTPLYASLLTKDAICDRFRDRYGERPSVDKEQPDVQFHIHVFRQKAIVYLDSSGDSLHKRGYKVAHHPAPINEVVAASLLQFAEWKQDCDLIDFMCGSGTILIEAAMLALNIPAGFYRSHFSFFNWKTFDTQLWEKIKKEAQIKDDVSIDFYGSDISKRFINMARSNIEVARLIDFIHLKSLEMSQSTPRRRPALVIINPPYGERLEIDNLNQFYKEIGDTFKKKYYNCTAWLLSSDFEAIKNVGLRSSRKISLMSGSLPCKFVKYELY